MIFDLSKGNEPGIENILKTGSTERKELKEESSQPESFSLKIGFFFFFLRSKNRFDQSNLEKSKNFENLGIFCRNIFKTVFMI